MNNNKVSHILDYVRVDALFYKDQIGMKCVTNNHKIAKPQPKEWELKKPWVEKCFTCKVTTHEYWCGQNDPCREEPVIVDLGLPRMVAEEYEDDDLYE
jgi:hypothetical protein